MTGKTAARTLHANTVTVEISALTRGRYGAVSCLVVTALVDITVANESFAHCHHAPCV